MEGDAIDHPAQAPPRPSTGVCPYCGAAADPGERCPSCGGRFDALSRQATQNEMGPWFIRDEGHPFRPGCRIETLRRLIAAGRVHRRTVIRGPSTHQFWFAAERVPGVSRLLGVCHACGREVGEIQPACPNCGASLDAPTDRQWLGLGAERDVAGPAAPELTAPAGPRADAGGAPPDAPRRRTPRRGGGWGGVGWIVAGLLAAALAGVVLQR